MPPSFHKKVKFPLGGRKRMISPRCQCSICHDYDQDAVQCGEKVIKKTQSVTWERK